MIDIGTFVAHLPLGDPFLGRDDGFVLFMKEAYRALIPGGFLTLRCPIFGHRHTVADPRNVRSFNEGTFLHFARPANREEEDWSWDLYGPDYGTRFVLIRTAQDSEATFTTTMQKPG